MHVHHIGIVVKSIEDSSEKLEKLFGLSAGEIKVSHERETRMVFLKAENMLIELLEPMGEKSSVAQFLKDRGEGIHHICFEAPDITSTQGTMQANGVRFSTEEPIDGFTGLRLFTVPETTCEICFEVTNAAKVQRLKAD